jgi:hypothetical protein
LTYIRPFPARTFILSLSRGPDTLESLDDVETDDLPKLVLLLVVVWLALEIAELLFEVVGLAFDVFFGPLKPLVGVAVLVLLVAWFVDAI